MQENLTSRSHKFLSSRASSPTEDSGVHVPEFPLSGSTTAFNTRRPVCTTSESTGLTGLWRECSPKIEAPQAQRLWHVCKPGHPGTSGLARWQQGQRGWRGGGQQENRAQLQESLGTCPLWRERQTRSNKHKGRKWATWGPG